MEVVRNDSDPWKSCATTLTPCKTETPRATTLTP